MPVPYAVARFNKRVTNRFVEPLARPRPWFGVVHHVGRTSGRTHRTPVRLFDASDGTRYVVLTYGLRADWVQNLLAQQDAGTHGQVEDRFGRWSISSAVIVDRAAGEHAIPSLLRPALRLLAIDELLHITLGDAGLDNAEGSAD